ncbi:MAG: hypothetical protein ACLTXH_01470 [Enterobacter hormaechei]
MNTSTSGSPQIRKIRKITQVTGKAPRLGVSHGAANGTSLAIAQKQGYQLSFTLRTGWQTRATSATSRAC